MGTLLPCPVELVYPAVPCEHREARTDRANSSPRTDRANGSARCGRHVPSCCHPANSRRWPLACPFRPLFPLPPLILAFFSCRCRAGKYPALRNSERPFRACTFLVFVLRSFLRSPFV